MQQPGEPGPVVLTLDGVLTRGAVASLCAELDTRLTLSGTRPIVFCDVSRLAAGLSSVDALARLQLTASRRGSRLCLRNASPDLQAMVTFLGLTDVLPPEAAPGSPPV